jgi:hypothetical protein
MPPIHPLSPFIALNHIRQACRFFLRLYLEIQQVLNELVRNPVQARALTHAIGFIVDNFGLRLRPHQYWDLTYVAMLRWHMCFSPPSLPVMRRLLKRT